MDPRYFKDFRVGEGKTGLTKERVNYEKLNFLDKKLRMSKELGYGKGEKGAAFVSRSKRKTPIHPRESPSSNPWLGANEQSA